jgi:hypothetical protein
MFTGPFLFERYDFTDGDIEATFEEEEKERRTGRRES